MADPFTIAGAASLGASAFTTLFGDSLDELNERNTRRNQAMIEARLAEMQRIFGQRGEFFQEQMDILNPQLAFADTQGRQAAAVGARAAQARLRRRLGEGGGVFAAALESGARTAASDRQNTLRALATSEAFRAADRQIASRVGALNQLPFAFFGPSTGGRTQQVAGMFAQLGTGLGAIGEFQKQPNQNQNTFQGSAFEPFPAQNLNLGLASA